MNLRLVVLATLFLVQPAAATQMVQLAAATPACPAGALACDPNAAKAPEAPEGGLESGSIIAGLAGLMVLALVFSQRKPVLPQVVS